MTDKKQKESLVLIQMNSNSSWFCFTKMANVNVIKANVHKYSASAMCKVLKVSRSTYYYEAKQKRMNPV